MLRRKVSYILHLLFNCIMLKLKCGEGNKQMQFQPKITQTDLLTSRYSFVFAKLYGIGQVWRLSSDTIFLLTWSSIIHIFGIYPLLFCVKLNFKNFPYLGVYLCIWRAFLFVMYPYFNYLGESCWSRYKVLILGTILSLIGVCMMGPSLAIIFRSCLSNLFSENSCLITQPIVIIAFIGIIVYFIGVSLFEANFISFGMLHLQLNSKHKTKSFLCLYVLVVRFSEFGGLPLIYLITSSGYWYGYCLLLPIIGFFILCSCDFKETEGSTNIQSSHGPLQLLQSYFKICSKKSCPVETDVARIFNQMFTMFISMMGYFLILSSRLQNNVFLVFDNEWLIGNEPYYFVTTEILQAVPILLMVVLFKKSFPFNVSPVKRIQFGLVLSIIVLIALFGCSIEFLAASGRSRDLLYFIPILLLLISLIKGISFVLTLLSVLHIIFLQTPTHLQGSLFAFFNCYQAIPFFLMTLNGVNNFLLHTVLLPIEAIVAVLGLIIFRKLCGQISTQKSNLPKINKSSNNVII